MTFGLRCLSPARRPRPASLPVRVPTVESLLRASFGFASRLRLAFRYGCHHQLRRAPFISIDSAHAGHTGADPGRTPWSARVPPDPLFVWNQLPAERERPARGPAADQGVRPTIYAGVRRWEN